ncbi:MAG: hypothetical protein KHY83_03845 [Coriobacteriia bacterium]|nr:hypothetical protein [Coriobacteriia bacterium]MBS5477779.1 hypothetical protein [Coriobacteriia bacterium]
MKFTGVSGITYQTQDKPLGRGGEGSVYAVEGVMRAGSATLNRPRPGDTRLVVKEFAAGRADAQRRAKLSAMVARRPPAAARAQLAWPLDIAQRDGHFTGYVMPQVVASHHLNEYYVASPTGIGGPGGASATYARQLTLAYNLAAAVACVHDLGQVIGDFNPDNALVDEKTWTVTLIDCDSFHITDTSGTVYRCGVGKPDYLAPEVHAALAHAPAGASLETLNPSPYSQQTDLFALAVHVFALLENGCHPFACAAANSMFGSSAARSCPQPVDNIKSGFSPFFSRRSGLTTPVYAPDVACLPPAIRALFKRAFVRGHAHPSERPSARAWAAELRTALQTLEPCPACGAEHPIGCMCPRCDVAQGMGKIRPTGSNASGHTGSQFAIPNPTAPRMTPQGRLGSSSAPSASTCRTRRQAARGSAAGPFAQQIAGARSAARQVQVAARRKFRPVAHVVHNWMAKPARGCNLTALLGLLVLAVLVWSIPYMPPEYITGTRDALNSDWRPWVTLAICTGTLLANVQSPQGDGHDGQRFFAGTVKAYLWGLACIGVVLFVDTYLASGSGPASWIEFAKTATRIATIVNLPLYALTALIYGLVGSVQLSRRNRP